ncbi:hypothetical protein B6U74_01955 [Candidatus Bathyarchaeota archaeon ex4484_205]|nr:MAG: hypothetical protein B6U74_01955 [Candidatus Bathyarchaeota archaeon ex4484_205]
MDRNLKETYLKKVKSERSLLEKIMTVFPGYRGYREKEMLRETDKLIRDELIKELKAAKEQLFDIERDFISDKDMRTAKRIEKLLMRVDTMTEKIRHATYGYAPRLNVIEVREKQLLKLMEFDANLATLITALRNEIDNFPPEDDGRKSIVSIGRILRKLEREYEKRDKYMLGLME